jgi:chemotaxis receptor (MCP) glutamine deamidase CheD
LYPGSRVVDVPKYLLHRYFDKEKGTGLDEDSVAWRVKQNLRDLIRFRRINFQDSTWPIQTKFDVIFCRNVMIYFDPDTQRKLVERFSNYLQPEGHLIIGHSETLSGISERYDLVGNTIYRLKPESGTPRRATFVRGASVASKPEAQPAPAKTSSSYDNEPVVKARQSVRVKEPIQPIIVGEIHASHEPKWITTLLGSCVSACLFDERLNVGGMNHFMLPIAANDSTTCASYGVHAMEMLINSLMKLGADRRRLKAKLFGGGAVIRTSDTRFNVGMRNVDFAKKFLADEGIPLVASHTGGTQAMHVRFHTRTNKAIVRVLDDQSAAQVVAAEMQPPKPLAAPVDSVTLF